MITKTSRKQRWKILLQVIQRSLEQGKESKQRKRSKLCNGLVRDTKRFKSKRETQTRKKGKPRVSISPEKIKFLRVLLVWRIEDLEDKERNTSSDSR